MNVNLHHLHLFYYTAKAGGISAAVKIIPHGVQQPAVSQQLIQLEQSFGAKLFVRKPFSLTPSGERLYRFISRFFDDLDLEIDNLRESAGIAVRFGCPAIISAVYLPELIGLVMEKYPTMRPYVTELDGVTINAALVNREIDVALSMAPVSKAKSIVTRKLVSIPMALMVPAGHRFVEKGFWPKSDFTKEKWIALQEDSGGTRELREGLSSLGVTPEFVVSTNSVTAALRYVEMGLGLALMARPPDNLLAAGNLAAVSVPDLFGSVDFSISWRADSELSAGMMDFIHKTAVKLSAKYARNE